jgi:hypothetical protein
MTYVNQDGEEVKGRTFHRLMNEDRANVVDKTVTDDDVITGAVIEYPDVLRVEWVKQE